MKTKEENKIKTITAVFKALQASCTEDSFRTALRGIQVIVDEKTVRLHASDGHTALQIVLDREWYGMTQLNESCSIPVDNVDEILLQLKRMAMNGELMNLTFAKAESKATSDIAALYYKLGANAGGKVVNEAHLNLLYLAEKCKQVASLVSKATGVRVTMGAEHSATQIYSRVMVDNRAEPVLSVTALVMPMRGF